MAQSQGFSSGDTGKGTVQFLGVTYNTNNYGVRALLSGAVAGLLRANSRLEFQILDYGRESALWEEQCDGRDIPLKLVNLRFSWRIYLPNNVFRLLVVAASAKLIPSQRFRRWLLSRNPWLTEILQARSHLSLAGGDSLSDIYGVRQFLYVALPQILVLWLGKPLVLLPQTYGPFRGRISRCVARYIFCRAKAICTRDAAGVQTIKALAGDRTAPIRIVPDLAFAMEPERVSERVDTQLKEWRDTGLLLGLNVSKLLHMGGYTGNNMFGLKEDYPRLINGLVDFVVNDLRASVLLVPHVYGGEESQESEVTLCRRLAAEFRSKCPGRIMFLDENFSHRQIKYVMGKCDVFVGARMHACIGALSQGIPTVALAYSDKFAGVMGAARVPAQVVDLRNANLSDLCLAVQTIVESRADLKKQLEKRLPEVKAAITALFESELFREFHAPRAGSGVGEDAKEGLIPSNCGLDQAPAKGPL